MRVYESTAGVCVTTGSVIRLDSIHNPERNIGTWEVTFRITMRPLRTWQIVGMLRIGNENALYDQLCPI